MMWVIRAGRDSVYYKEFLDNQRVYLSWEDFKYDLSKIAGMPGYRSLVEQEKGSVNRSSISNWAGQLNAFVKVIAEGDYVLIPSQGSKSYCVAKIIGAYEFDEANKYGLYHSRKIRALIKGIPRNIFSQEVVYSLGAYRTIFIAHHEEEIIRSIKKWKENRRG